MSTRGGRVAVCFVISVASSIGFIIGYVLDAHIQIEGALAAVALGALGLGLVVWAKEFMPGGNFVELRAPHEGASARSSVEEAFAAGADAIDRRRLLGRLLGIAVGGLGVAALFPIRSLGPSPGRSLFVTSWRAGARLVTPDGVPVHSDALEVGGLLTVFPEGYTDAADSQTVLVRIDADDLEVEEERRDWVPLGYVAYSKICTHAGCPVGLYEAESRQLFCPCHQSAFDAARGADPLSGPATRPLPQLPLDIDEQGFLIARGDFPEPVGPGFWDFG